MGLRDLLHGFHNPSEPAPELSIRLERLLEEQPHAVSLAPAMVHSAAEPTRPYEQKVEPKPPRESLLARLRAVVSNLLSIPVPAGLVLAASAALVVITWRLFVDTTPGPAGAPPSEIRSYSPVFGGSQPVSTTTGGSITVSGMVVGLQTSRTGDLDTSIVTLRDLDGKTYRIVTLGKPLIRAGDMVQATANFSKTSRSADALTYEGAGTIVRLRGFP